MNLNVTQDNLYLFLPSKVSRMAEMLSQDEKCDATDAVRRIYLSATYKRMEREESKAWHQSPVDAYNDFKKEQ